MKPKQTYYRVSDEACAHLCAQDAILGEYIEKVGILERPQIPDLFEAMLFQIVSQLISRKAADTVWAKVTALCEGEVTSARVLSLSKEALRACGMSGRKVDTILEIAAQFCDGTLSQARVSAMTDEEVVKALTAIKGVGVWTAEMLLIFSLGRHDVVSFGDLIIRRGMMQLYDLKTLSREKFTSIQKNYSPFGTAASFYLWHIGATPEQNYVYIVQCKDGSYYTGWTNHLERRITAHNEGKGAKYTKARGPVKLVYHEIFGDRSSAMKREYQIKTWSRAEKERLIQTAKVEKPL